MPPPDGASARDATERYAERLRRRAVGGLRFDASERRRILGILREVEEEIVSRLSRFDPTGVSQTAAQRRRLEALLTDTRTRMREMIRGIRNTSASALTDYAAAEATWAHTALNNAVSSAGIQTAVRVAPAELLRGLVANAQIVGVPLNDWWSRQADSLTQSFAQQMRLGVAQGDTLDQLIRRVRGTRANSFKDGIMETTRRQAAALVRTSVNAIGNQARTAVYEANADLITAEVHSSTLDSRTTLQCSARDGKAWDMATKAPIGGHSVPYQVPPIHVGCRSVLLPRIGQGVRIPGQRASADGPVPASQTFETWLRGKTNAEQSEILGPGRARLWREQKLTLSQLLDFRGDPLSLEELTRRFAD
jgi:hypothetical protein